MDGYVQEDVLVPQVLSWSQLLEQMFMSETWCNPE